MPGTATIRPRLLPVGLFLSSVCLAELLAAALTGGASGVWFSVEFLGGLLCLLIVVQMGIWADKWTRDHDFFSPLVAFPIAYVFWFVIGSLDVVKVPSSVSFGLFDPMPLYIWGYVVLGLVAFLCGNRLMRGGVFPEVAGRSCRFRWDGARFWQIVVLLSVLTAGSYIYIVLRIGIPALSADAGQIRLELAKFGVAQAILFSSAWTLIPFLVAYLWLHELTKAGRFSLWASVCFIAVLLLSLGGRSQLFVPFAVALVMRHYMRRRFRLIRLGFLVLAAFCAVSVFGYVRDTALTGGNEAAEWLNVPSAVMPFVYAYLYIRFPVATFRDITVAIPRTTGFQYGALTFGPLDSLLPGHHHQSDMYFKELLGNDFIGAGQPATLLGPLYADGGAVGIGIGLFVFGIILAAAFRWMQADMSAYRVLVYAWIVQTGLFSFFSNLFPYITTLWLPVMWFLLDCYLVRSRPGAISAGRTAWRPLVPYQ